MPGLGFEPRSLQSTILPFQTRPAGPYRLVSDAVLTYYTTRALLNLSGLIYIYRERERVKGDFSARKETYDTMGPHDYYLSRLHSIPALTCSFRRLLCNCRIITQLL